MKLVVAFGLLLVAVISACKCKNYLHILKLNIDFNLTIQKKKKKENK